MAKVNLNEDLCKHLTELAVEERDINQNKARFFAYMKASRALSQHDKKITSGKEAQKLNGVGPKVALLIDKFLNGEEADGAADGNGDSDDNDKPVASSNKDNGKRSKSKDTGNHSKDDGPPAKKSKSSNSADSMRILDLYEKLYMDKKTALGLQVKDVNTVGDLRKDTSLITSAQAACLEHIADLVQPISEKEEVEAVAKELKKRIKEKLGDHFRLTVCGAYRRSDKLDSSLSILLVHKELKSTSKEATEELSESLKKVLAALKEGGLLKYRLDDPAKSTDRFEALIKLPSNIEWPLVRRLHLRIVPADCSIGAIFTLTGSEQFVKSIIFEALERRYILDENGLRRLGATSVPGELIPLKSEVELFEFLELPFVKPEERN